MNEERKGEELVQTEPNDTPRKNKKQTNNYWDKVESAYKTALRVFLIALPVYVILFAAICWRAFTYESLYTLLKDVRATASFVSADYQNVSYTYEQGERDVLAFRGGVAVVSENAVEIYSPSGELSLVKEMQYEMPRAVASRKFLVVYDWGQTGFTVASSYTRVHEGTMEYPIYMAEVADTGHFAFVTPSAEDPSRVYLYNENCKLIHCFKKEYAVTGVAISENGSHLAIVGLATTAGKANTIVEVYRIGDTTPGTTLRFDGEMPLAIDFTNNRHLSVLTDGALRVVGLDGSEKRSVALDASIVAFESNENGCVALVRTDELTAEHRVVVLGKKGQLLVNDKLHGAVSDVVYSEEYVFILSGDRLLTLSVKNGELSEIDCGEGATGLVAVDAKRVRVAYAGEVRLYTVE